MLQPGVRSLGVALAESEIIFEYQNKVSDGNTGSMIKGSTVSLHAQATASSPGHAGSMRAERPYTTSGCSGWKTVAKYGIRLSNGASSWVKTSTCRHNHVHEFETQRRQLTV